MVRLVIEAEMSGAIAQFLTDGDRLRSEHDRPPGCEVAEHWMAPGLDRFPATSRQAEGYESRSNSRPQFWLPRGVSGGPLAATQNGAPRAPTPDQPRKIGL